MPTAPMAAGPSGLTIRVSTMPMLIQPSSAVMTGAASRATGGSEPRSAARRAPEDEANDTAP